jgi:hypothetical protein
MSKNVWTTSKCRAIPWLMTFEIAVLAELWCTDDEWDIISQLVTVIYHDLSEAHRSMQGRRGRSLIWNSASLVGRWETVWESGCTVRPETGATPTLFDYFSNPNAMTHSILRIGPEYQYFCIWAITHTLIEYISRWLMSFNRHARRPVGRMK